VVQAEYSDVIVNKPWGYEYLCYQNEVLAIWFLHIRGGERTSLHCHPNKNTGFVVLQGQVELSFLRNKMHLNGLDKIHIFRGRFHSTRALSEDGAYILEIETPEDKHDLVRLEDSYGREGKPYEGREYETPKNRDCLWLREPEGGDYTCRFDACTIRHFAPAGREDVSGYPETDFFVVARGGMRARENANILWPGDVIDGVSLARLAASFELIPDTSLIHIRQ